MHIFGPGFTTVTLAAPTVPAVTPVFELLLGLAEKEPSSGALFMHHYLMLSVV